MNIIVAVDNNWAIGNKGQLLTKIPEDLKFFKKKTIGKIVIMGRKTFESLPNKSPLINRINIILTSNPQLYSEKLKYFDFLSLPNPEISRYPTIFSKNEKELLKIINYVLNVYDYEKKDVYFIGGAQIYKIAESICSVAYVTKIFKTFEADSYMMNLDCFENWHIVSEDLQFLNCGLKVAFTKYIKIF